MQKYDELKKRKLNGEKFDWNKITKEELTTLYKANLTDSSIAEIYDINPGKVRYKRNKWNITLKNIIISEMMEEDDLFSLLNEDSKKRLLDKNNIDTLSKAITHYIFRNRTCRRYTQ